MSYDLSPSGLITVPNSGLGAFIGADGRLRSSFKLPVNGAVVAADTGGGIISIKNCFGQDVIVTDLMLDFGAVNGGAGTVDAGIGASGTTSYDNLIDGATSPTSVNALGSYLDSQNNAGSNGRKRVLWAANNWLTVSTATGTNVNAQVFAHVTCTTKGVTKP